MSSTTSFPTIIFIIIFCGVGLSPLGTAATTDGDCGAIGGIKIGRGN
jgi:hypothetical protein